MRILARTLSALALAALVALSRLRCVRGEEAQARGVGQEAPPVRHVEDQGRRQGRVKNLKEFKLGTNPRKADSDKDGLKDGDEVKSGNDPLKRRHRRRRHQGRRGARRRRDRLRRRDDHDPRVHGQEGHRDARHRVRRARADADRRRRRLRRRRSPTSTTSGSATRPHCRSRRGRPATRKSSTSATTRTRRRLLRPRRRREGRRPPAAPSSRTATAHSTSSPSSRLADRDHPLDRQPGALGDRLRHLHHAALSRSVSRSFGSVIIFM